jgi:hypothetical protein
MGGSIVYGLKLHPLLRRYIVYRLDMYFAFFHLLLVLDN